MAKIINVGYTSNLRNRGITLTGESDELYDDVSIAEENAQFLIDEAPDGSDIYVWQDSEEKWHVGW